MLLDHYLKERSNILTEKGYDISRKAKAITEILECLDYDCNEFEKEKYYRSLDRRVQNAIEELWIKFYASPKNNGHWTGEPCNSTWIPEDNVIPPNKSYSNIFGLTWLQIKRKHSFGGLRCERGRFCFEDIAHYMVEIADFAGYVNSPVRTALHEAAFAVLAKKSGKSIAEIKAIKESAADQTPMGHKNLVWHEDIDCRSLYLVPQEIHGNIIHFGGIAMCNILKIHGLC